MEIDSFFYFLPGDKVIFGRDVEINLEPVSKEHITIPKGFKATIKEALLNSTLVCYTIEVSIGEIDYHFYKESPDRKAIIREVIEEIDFNDCDFITPKRCLLRIENMGGILKISKG